MHYYFMCSFCETLCGKTSTKRDNYSEKKQNLRTIIQNFFFSQMTFDRNRISALIDGNLTFMNLYFKMNLNMSSNEQCQVLYTSSNTENLYSLIGLILLLNESPKNHLRVDLSTCSCFLKIAAYKYVKLSFEVRTKYELR